MHACIKQYIHTLHTYIHTYTRTYIPTHVHTDIHTVYMEKKNCPELCGVISQFHFKFYLG